MQGTRHSSQSIGAFESFCPPLCLHSCNSWRLDLCFCPLKCISNAAISEHQIWQTSHLGAPCLPWVVVDSLFIFMYTIFALWGRPFRCCCSVRALEQLAWQRWQSKLSAGFLIMLPFLVDCDGVGTGWAFLFKPERDLFGMLAFETSLSPWTRLGQMFGSCNRSGWGVGLRGGALLWRFGFPLEYVSWDEECVG